MTPRMITEGAGSTTAEPAPVLPRITWVRADELRIGDRPVNCGPVTRTSVSPAGALMTVDVLGLNGRGRRHLVRTAALVAILAGPLDERAAVLS